MSAPWRYRCPDGHATWTPVDSPLVTVRGGGPYYCNICDEHFDELRDTKNGDEEGDQ